MPKRQNTKLVPVSRGFDYESLQPAQAKRLRAAARNIRDKMAKSIRGLFEVGQEFLAARETVEQGEFMDWVAAEGWHYRTAKRLMDLAEQFGPIIDSVSGFKIPASALYHLAAPTTPFQARDMVIQKAKAGERLTVAAVDNIIVSFKKPAPRLGRTFPVDGLSQKLAQTMEWIWDHHEPRDEGEIARQLREYAALWEQGKRLRNAE